MKRITFIVICVMLSTYSYAQSFNDMLKAAQKGDANAQGYIGYCYLNGDGVPKNEKLAFEWTTKSAVQGNSAAQHILGWMFYSGTGTPQNYLKAFEWFTKAAEQGSADGQYAIGNMLIYAEGVARNEKQGFEWMKKAAMNGCVDAQSHLGELYYNGLATSKDLSKSFEWRMKAAEQGHAYSQLCIGQMYCTGEGTPKDEKRGFEWIRNSAIQGYADAEFLLGRMLLEGIGTQKNILTAIEWITKSAEKENIFAQTYLGKLYLDGEYVSKDTKKAFELFLRSAQQGFVEAQVQIGYMYSCGLGVEANEEEAFRWNRMAAEAGNAIAQANLSWNYFKGKGTDVDYEEAYYWAKKSAEQDQELGYENLANCYLVGSRKDINKAIECLDKSIELCVNSGRAKSDKTYLLRLYNKKGVIYLNENDFTKAEEMANMILDVNPLYVDEVDNRLMAYMQTGEIGTDNKEEKTQIKRTKPSSDVDIEIPQLGITNEIIFAVIIANENYEEETQVEYALNDGEIFKTYCKEVLGLPESNIHYRENATLNNLLAELDWMKQISTAFGDEAKFIFYYAGHGIPDEASGDAYLLPVDGRGNMLATGYSLNKLYETLGGITAKSVIVFMDACFSGAVRDGGMMASARGVAIKAKQAAPKGNMIVLSAAQGDETAYPYKEKGHGLFTYYLLKKLQETKGDVTLGELSDYITSEVKKRSIIANGKLQTPIVTTSISATDWRNWTLK